MKTKILLIISTLLSGAVAVCAQVPAISSLSPASGPVGTHVIITGDNFAPDSTQTRVYFGSVRAPIISATINQLEVVVPAYGISGPVTIRVNDLFSVSAKPFAVTSAQPGTFTQRYDMWAGGQVKWATVADLDGDGKPDMLAVDEAWNQFYAWLNTSTPSAPAWSLFSWMISFSSNSAPYHIEVADLNGDGLNDVITTSSAGSVGVMINNSSPGNISFAPQVDFATAPTPYFIAVRDLDKDGRLDIAVACANNFTTGSISVLRNNSSAGTVSFEPHVDFPVGDGGVWCVRLEDLDGDDKEEIIATSGGSQILSVFKNTTTPGSIDITSFASRVDFATEGYPAIIATADFDRDGKTDLAVGNAGGNSISVFHNEITSGQIDPSSLVATIIPTQAPWNPTAADANGDGATDIIVRDADGNLVVFTNTSVPGTFNFNPSLVALGGTPLSINIADIDGDTKSDLIVSNEGWNVMHILQNFVITPPTLSAAWISNTGFELHVNPVPDVYNYILEVSTTPDFSANLPEFDNVLVSGSPWNESVFVLSAREPDTYYYCRARSVAADTSGYSDVLIVRTNSNPPVASPNITTAGFGQEGWEEIQSMVADKKDNVYIAGYYTQTLKLGGFTLTASDPYDRDIFLAKLDANQKVVWAKSIGGAQSDYEVSIAIDNTGVYLTGHFQNQIDVDPGAATQYLNNEGDWTIPDLFFAKYNTSNGKLIWAKHITDAQSWSSSSIGVDKSGVYLTGYFYNSVDFDPGAGVRMLTSNGDADIFLAKYDTKGEHIWSWSFGGYGYDSPWGVLVDESGIYIHGVYSYYSNFDPSGSKYFYDNGGFFAAYNSNNGAYKYARAVSNGRVFTMSRYQDKLYVAGDFKYYMDADPSENDVYLYAEGTGDNGFIGQYDLLTGDFGWAKELRTKNFLGPRKVIADASGIYVNGYVAGSSNFDPGNDLANRTPSDVNTFVAHYGLTDGRYDWAKVLGPSLNVSITAALTPTGYYVGGLYAYTVNFDPYTGSVTKTSTIPSTDLYVAKYQLSGHTSALGDTEVVLSEVRIEESSLYPNPVSDQLNIELRGFDPGPVEVSVSDLVGKVATVKTLNTEGGALTVTALPAGLYIFRAWQGNRVFTQRFIKK